jgi:acetamidase/formamidase
MFTRSLLLACFSLSLSVACYASDYTLSATPSTVAWGYYSAKAKPVLSIHSGDIVHVETSCACPPPEHLEQLGIKPSDVPQFYRDVYEKVTDKGPGGHILTGPIAIEEAEPGDVLEVRVLKIDMNTPFAVNSFGAGRGFLPDDFPYGRNRVIPLDREKMVAHFSPGIDIPLHPFFGSMGVAPPESAGRYNSAPPWMHAGNMDNKELVAGTTLYIPVQAKGALFEVGDGHGEVDITAMETFLTGTFQFIVHKNQHLLWPRAETPTAYIAMGFNEDLKQATEMAVRNMIDFLVTEKNLTRDEAYMLTSVAIDVDITQLVDGKVGVHAICPKAIFTK